MLEKVTAEAAAAGADVGQARIDFVEDFAIHVPLIIICELLGLDPDQRLSMYKWSDDMMAGDGNGDDPKLIAAAEAFGEYATMLIGLIAERRENPTDDIISALTQAFDEGGLAREHEKAYQGVTKEELESRESFTGLNDDELLAFLTVLLVAGNETTRNAISGGLMALSKFPEQKQLMIDNLWDDEFMDRAIDELIRYVTPVLRFIRTATTATTTRAPRSPRATGSSCYTRPPTARGGVRPAPTSSTSPASQPAPGLRDRPALLPRLQPGQGRGQARVPGAAQPHPRHRGPRGHRRRPRRVVAGDRSRGHPGDLRRVEVPRRPLSLNPPSGRGGRRRAWVYWRL